MVSVLQHHRDEPADTRKSLCVKNSGQLGRVGGQEPVGPEFGRTQPGGAHLGQHPVAMQLITPAGHLTDTPRNRRSGNLDHHALRTSSMRTGTPRRSDSVAASASQATSTASATVAPGIAAPLTTETNPASSARKASVNRSIKK